jgi:hypothetical protein
MKPVGWWNEKRRINWLDAVLETKEDGWNTPLYTAPRKLSDEEILETVKDHFIGAIKIGIVLTNDNVLDFARAILKKASEK